MNKFKTNLEIVLESGDEQIDGVLFKKVKEHLLKSGGRLKSPLGSGQITLNKIITAIKNERCLRTDDRDLGNTYLEQMVGSAIRKTVPTNYINRTRILFGLSKLSPNELHKEKKKRIHKAPTLEPTHTKEK